MKTLRAALNSFKKALGSLLRRTKRIEDQQLYSHRETQRKLDLILKAFKPETMLALDTLPQTVQTVQQHDEWIRGQEAAKRQH